jgi:hypothetical protein
MVEPTPIMLQDITRPQDASPDLERVSGASPNRASPNGASANNASANNASANNASTNNASAKNASRDLKPPPTTSRYLKLANTLLVISTFAGTVTFSVLLTATNTLDVNGDSGDSGVLDFVKKHLGYASALFLGSVTGVFPILLLLQRVKTDESPGGYIFFFTMCGFVIITALMTTAFFLLMLVLQHYTVKGAFILGLVLLGISTALSLSLALWNLGSLDGFKKHFRAKDSGGGV